MLQVDIVHAGKFLTKLTSLDFLCLPVIPRKPDCVRHLFVQGRRMSAQESNVGKWVLSMSHPCSNVSLQLGVAMVQ